MKEIILAHSELTNTIYALIGKDKIDITEQAIAEVKAIKALEQEPKTDMLDKIRVEIETLNPVDYVSMSSYEGHKGASDMKDDILQIIDKYSEG